MHFVAKRATRQLGLAVATMLVTTSVADARLRLPLTSHSAVERREMTLGSWRLRIERGSFTREVRCYLADPKHHIAYVRGALGFRFGHHLNTLGAWTRIDDAAATRWQDELPELTRLGVPIDGPGLDDPTDSTVWIPARRLADANRVTIQPDERTNPRNFHLAGFEGLREIGRSMGCVPEGRFLP